MANLSSGEYNPLPSVSTGNEAAEYMGVLAEQIRRVAMPVFEAELHRKRKTEDPDTMGILWRPNNYRRKLGLSDGKSIPDTTLVSLGRWYSSVKRTKKSVVFINDYPGVLLLVGRRTVTGIWRQELINGQKAVYSVRAPTLAALQGMLEGKKEEIRQKIDLAILDFCDRVGLSPGVPIWERSEDWIRDAGYRVPAGSLVYLEGAKKVYDEGLEFTTKSGESPMVGLQSFLEARSIEKISPEIAAELAALRLQVARTNEILSKAEIKIPEKLAPKTGQKKLGRWFE